MKLAALPLFLALGFNGYAQDNFPSQLKALVKDSVNNLNSFRSGFKKLLEQDSVFYSSIELEGTSKNEILVSTSGNMYMADVATSRNEKQGRKVVDDWKEKILWITGGRFKLTKLKKVDWNPGVYGWKFEHGNVWIDLTLYPRDPQSSSDYFIVFSVSYYDWTAIMSGTEKSAYKLP